MEPRPAMEQEHFPSERMYEIPELQNDRMASSVLIPDLFHMYFLAAFRGYGLSCF